jgi:hypothetical protein
MKTIGLILLLLGLLLGLFLGTVAFSVTLKGEAIIYASDDNEPLTRRFEVAILPASTKVKVLQCIDIKSDQYLMIQV